MKYSRGFILASQPNFRDFGGIQTSNGKTIKPGLIFRSGDLPMLTPEDRKALEGLGLRSIVDFRSAREIAKRPDQPVSTVTNHFHFPIEDVTREIAMRLFDDHNADGLKNLLVNDYRRMVRDHADAFRQFFDCLQNGDTLPLVFHCAAGKDRTGMAAWFLLSALNVSNEIIREDYLSTNIFTRIFADKIVAKTNEKGMHGEIIRPLLEVRNEYIDSALDEIEHLYGGLERFLFTVLKADRKKLEELFLSDHS